jgi:exodeoxyribonuclease VII small subunit
MKTSDLTKLKYAELRQQLDEVSSWFGGDDIDLDKATDAYAKGMELIAELESRLKDAKAKVEKTKQDFAA